MTVTALATGEPQGPTLAELAAVAAMAEQAGRLCREIAATLARWGMEALEVDDDG